MAKALKFHAIVRGKTLPLPDLAAFEGKRVEVIVVEDEDEDEDEDSHTSAARPGPKRHFGSFAGKFSVPDDFDAPLPDDILSAFEGKEEDV